jgi:AGCS family alanine or glycine:cation symporter
MMIPNLIGVVVMLPLVIKITKNYIDRKIKNKDVEPVVSYDSKLVEDFKQSEE